MTYPQHGPNPQFPHGQQPMAPPPTASRELTMVACGLGAITGVAGVGYGGYLAVTRLLDENWGDAAAGLVTVLGGVLMLAGAGLLKGRRRAGPVLMIIAAVLLVAPPAAGMAKDVAVAFAIAGFAVVSAVLAWVVRSWCVPKQPRHPQGPWQPPGGGHWQPPQPGGYQQPPRSGYQYPPQR